MPIYEYLCNSCGVKKEHLQKMSDAPIKVCPACGSESYAKLVSAAGFQLKGSGWYVTDFKDKPASAAAKQADKGGAQATDAKASKSDSTDAASGSKTDSGSTTSSGSGKSSSDGSSGSSSTAKSGASTAKAD